MVIRTQKGGDDTTLPTRPIMAIYYGDQGDAHAYVVASTKLVSTEEEFAVWKMQTLSTGQILMASVNGR
jgi:hypothetical protein